MLTVLEVSFSVLMALGGALIAIFAKKVNRISMIIGTSIIFGLLAVALGFTTNLFPVEILMIAIGPALPVAPNAKD